MESHSVHPSVSASFTEHSVPRVCPRGRECQGFFFVSNISCVHGIAFLSTQFQRKRNALLVVVEVLSCLVMSNSLGPYGL